MNKTRKIRKNRGKKTGWGCKKKHRGAGNRGGVGRAGILKHKWSWVTAKNPDIHKNIKLKSYSKKVKIINLSQINDIIIKQKITKELDLSDYKVLGSGKITTPAKIKAYSFSAKALDKIKEAGGTAEPLVQEGFVEETPAVEAPAEEGNDEGGQ